MSVCVLSHSFQISIHAPREGSDTVRMRARLAGEISIHAPREGSDVKSMLSAPLMVEFLSTLPARGATSGQPGAFDRLRPDFYPRSPRGERQQMC